MGLELFNTFILLLLVAPPACLAAQGFNHCIGRVRGLQFPDVPALGRMGAVDGPLRRLPSGPESVPSLW